MILARHMGIFFVKTEFDTSISSTIRSSFRLTVRLVVDIQRFVCNRATPSIVEKLRSKGVAMHAYGVSAHE